MITLVRLASRSLNPIVLPFDVPFAGLLPERIINAVYMYNAFYYPEFGRATVYMNRNNNWIWLNPRRFTFLELLLEQARLQSIKIDRGQAKLANLLVSPGRILQSDQAACQWTCIEISPPD